MMGMWEEESKNDGSWSITDKLEFEMILGEVEFQVAQPRVGLSMGIGNKNGKCYKCRNPEAVLLKEWTSSI